MNATAGSFRHLRIAVILVFSVLVLGTAGYMLIEQLSFVDALYTTISMMATLGLLIKPLSEYGRIFTIAVTVLGVASLLYTFGVGMFGEFTWHPPGVPGPLHFARQRNLFKDTSRGQRI